jgi:hypothetical protein
MSRSVMMGPYREKDFVTIEKVQHLLVNIFLTIYFLTAGHTLCCTSCANKSDCDNKENELFQTMGTHKSPLLRNKLHTATTVRTKCRYIQEKIKI